MYPASVSRRRQAEPSSDPGLLALREADREYHRLCIDIQEPDVPAEQLPLDELASVIAHPEDAARQLLTRS